MRRAGIPGARRRKSGAEKWLSSGCYGRSRPSRRICLARLLLRLIPLELVLLCLLGWFAQVWLSLLIRHVISLGARSSDHQLS
jgi:hypothetical protein